MNAREVNVLLTQAALLDPRMRRDPNERAQMSIAWADVLADVNLRPALHALTLHYQQSRESVMPADIIALVDDVPVETDREYVQARAWLEQHGIDPDVFEERIAAGELPTRVLRELGAGAGS